MNELHYAVVVGIDRYPGISDLTGAKADATKFAEWLLHPEGGALPRDNVQVLVKSPDEEATYMSLETAEPTQDSIDDALRNVVNAIRAHLDVDRSAWPRTRLYLYVAGHGFAPAWSEGSFLVANAGPGIYSRNLDLPKYRAYCSACAFFSEVVIFADCCRTRVQPGPEGTGPRLDPCPTPFVDREPTWLIGFAAEVGRDAYELTFGEDDEARGYFTRALLEGLRGSAADSTGAVTARSLADHVVQVVETTTRDKRFPQQARFPGDVPALVFRPASETVTRAKRPVTIVFPPGYTARVVLRLNLKPIIKHDTAEGPLRIELQDGYYEVAPDAGEPAAAFADNGLFKVSGEGRNVSL